jgi:hypothetical protein
VDLRGVLVVAFPAAQQNHGIFLIIAVSIAKESYNQI